MVRTPVGGMAASGEAGKGTMVQEAAVSGTVICGMAVSGTVVSGRWSVER